MPPRKDKTATFSTEGAKLGSPVPKAIVDTNTTSVGIPPEPNVNGDKEVGLLRKQIDSLRQQIVDVGSAAKSGLRQGARQTEATVKLYPASTLLTVAAVAGALAFAIGALRAAPPRSRYDRSLGDLRDLYERLRERL